MTAAEDRGLMKRIPENMVERARGGRRRLDIDGMRLLAACFVLMYHFGLFPLHSEGSTPMNLYVRSVLACCVPIFFFLTGVLYSHRRISFQESRNKVVKLFLLTLVWSLIIWPIRAFQRGLDVSLNLYIAGVLTLQQGVTNYLWFCPALAIVYLLLPLLCAIADENQCLLKRMTLVACLFVFGLDALQRAGEIAGWVLDTQIFLKGVNFLNNFNPLRAVYGFSIAFCLVGMVWEDIEGRLTQGLAGIGLILAPVLLAGYSAFRMQTTHEVYDPTWFGYGCASTLVVVICLFSIVSKHCSRIDPDSGLAGLVNYIGSNSFGVYLLHHPLMGPIAACLISTARHINMEVPVGLIFCVLAVAVLAFVSAMFARTKVGKWLLSV